MSTHWDVFCRTCNEGCGLHINHASEFMMELCDNRAALAVIGSGLESLCANGYSNTHGTQSFDSYGGLLDVALFFSKHVGHDIVPKNEYGDCIDECRERTPGTRCPCGREYSCALPKGHDGAHSFKGPAK